MWRDAAGTLQVRATAGARIVSLVPSLTELVCDLGLASQLVGRTGFCVHPRATVKTIPKVGGTKNVNHDRVRTLAPTHVLLNIDENEKATAEALARFVPHLIVTHPLEPLDNFALYRMLGGIFDREREAEALCMRLQQAYDKLLQLSAQRARGKVLYLIWKDPWMTIARDTYISRMLALAGWDSLPAQAQVRYPRIDLEDPALAEAEQILLASEPFPFRQQHLSELRDLPTLRGKQLALIDGEMTSWYGSRAIAGLEYLLRLRA